MIKLMHIFLRMVLSVVISYPNLYVQNFGTNILIVVLYVDDLIITSSQLTLIQNLKSDIQKQFEMTEFGLLHYFLGVQIWHMEDGMFLS